MFPNVERPKSGFLPKPSSAVWRSLMSALELGGYGSSSSGEGDESDDMGDIDDILARAEVRGPA